MQRLRTEDGPRIVLQANKPGGNLDVASQIAVLRISEELMVNALRHSEAKTVTAFFRQMDGRLEFGVSDDGQGFEPTAIAAESGHFGLSGVRQRVADRGGEMEIQSRPGGGTAISVSMPIKP